MTIERRGMGQEWERGSRGGDIRILMADFMLMYGGGQHNIVKQLSSNLFIYIFFILQFKNIFYYFF